MSSPESYFGEERARYYFREEEERRKEKTLTHLIESRRAEDSEAAERYLENLNAIKEKLVLFVRDELSAERSYREPSIHPRIEYGSGEASSANLDQITLEDIDRNKSELWTLERTVDSGTYVGTRDRLQIGLSNSQKVRIFPDFGGIGEGALYDLQKYLTKEDLEFVIRESDFAAMDLEKSLRAAADRIVREPKPSFSWRNFSPAKEKESPSSNTTP